MAPPFRALERPSFGTFLVSLAVTGGLGMLTASLHGGERRAEDARAGAQPDTGTVLLVDRRVEVYYVDDQGRREDSPSSLTSRKKELERYYVSYAYGPGASHTATFEATTGTALALHKGDALPVLVDPADPTSSEPADGTMMAGGSRAGGLLAWTILAGVAALLAGLWTLWILVRLLS